MRAALSNPLANVGVASLPRNQVVSVSRLWGRALLDALVFEFRKIPPQKQVLKHITPGPHL